MSFAIAFAVIVYLKKRQTPFDKVLKVCFGLAIVSEVTKILSNIEIVPVVKPVVENGVLVYKEIGSFTPYLEAEHLPFELCSLQILFLFLALVIKNKKILKPLYALMYTTCIIGGAMAIILSSEAPGRSTVADFACDLTVWRFFIYHIMLVALGVYIGISKECGIRFRDLKTTVALVMAMDFISLYMNSIMSTPYYSGNDLMGVGNAINYFSSYNNPLGIVMSTKGQWMIYLLIRLVLAVIIIALVNLPLLAKEKKEKK